jgi:dTDP-4-dehydrorhamnose reductase
VRVLVVGSDGQLGKELIDQGGQRKFEILAVDYKQMDIADPVQVTMTMAEYQPALIINAAAYTQVDRAESESEFAFAVNRDGPTYLAQWCNQARIPLIQISTDFVFNGEKRAPYTESDPISPISVYGRSKADGETAVRSHLKEHIIIRTSWLYSAHGHNFVKTMLRLVRAGKEIRVVADQYGSPTCADDLAEAVWTIVAQLSKGDHSPWGTYHYCGHGITTWFHFSEKIIEIAGEYISKQSIPITPISTSEYYTAAKRPLFSALDCQRIKTRFGIAPKPWQDSLEITIKRILGN